MSASVLEDGGEPHIAQQTARADSRSTNENEEKEVFNEDLPNFREAVKWSGFVDRSLLIEELLSKVPSRVIIFAPRRFGKSMNVDMVKCFLEIEGNRDVTNAPQDLKELKELKNFQAFHRYELKQPCKILDKQNLVKEHFGRHPVVYISFKDVKVSSFQAVENSVRQLVHFAYLEHPYLEDGEIFSDPRENEHANKDCTVWCNGRDYKDEDAQLGLQHLIKYLHAYHKRKVYLLVDEFDAPQQKALLAGKSRDEVNKINSELTNLLGEVLKGPVADEHLLGSLVTGVSDLEGFGMALHLNNVTVYKWRSDGRDRFDAYYGLFSEDD